MIFKRLLRFIGFAILGGLIGFAPVIRALECDVEVPILVCGNNFLDTFTETTLEKNYLIDLNAGNMIELQVYPENPGHGFSPLIELIAPSGSVIATSEPGDYESASIGNQPLIDSGRYTIRVSAEANSGPFELIIPCVVNGAGVINDGVADVASGSAELPNCRPATPVGIEVPGSLSVTVPDVSGLAAMPLLDGIPASGSFSEASAGSIAYTLEVGNDASLNLTVERVVGNFNLAVAVLSEDNYIVFLGTLIPSGDSQPTLTTRFPLTAGIYTITVFKITSLPAATPETSAFMLTTALEP